MKLLELYCIYRKKIISNRKSVFLKIRYLGQKLFTTPPLPPKLERSGHPCFQATDLPCVKDELLWILVSLLEIYFFFDKIMRSTHFYQPVRENHPSSMVCYFQSTIIEWRHMNVHWQEVARISENIWLITLHVFFATY